MSKTMGRDKRAGGLALLYAPEGYDGKAPNLMGRQAAGAGFLRALANHGPEELFCYTRDKSHYEDFAARVRAEDPGGRHRLEWIPAKHPERIREAGTFFTPTPDLAEMAWKRRLVEGGDSAFSICGVTHTLPTHRVMESIGESLIAPSQPWDALICTSRSGQAAVHALLELWSDHLQERTGGRPPVRFETPVIPLGIDCDFFDHTRIPEEEIRRIRQTLAIGPDEVVVLFHGRLSYHAKAHPFPMYVALGEAARRTGRKVRLVLSGWFATDSIRAGFVDAARTLCPEVGVTLVDGRRHDLVRMVWHVAHIFCSLSDNVQETFGLTPLEAMAAGLPALVTDWDGYRDTVRHGVDGFRVPTVAPAPGAGRALALDHARGEITYDHFIGEACLSTAVDLRATIEAMTALVGDPGLRGRMGREAARHAREEFDWAVVLKRYTELWEELGRIRREAGSGTGGGLHPGRADPFLVCARWPTRVLSDDMRIGRGPLPPELSLEMLRTHPTNRYGSRHLGSLEDCRSIVALVKTCGTVTLGELRRESPSLPGDIFERTVGWLLKMGVLEVIGLGTPSEPDPELATSAPRESGERSSHG